MKVLKHHIKALRIHRQLRRINSELFKSLEKQMNKKYRGVFLAENLDRKTWLLVNKLITTDQELKAMGTPAESANLAVHKILEALDSGESDAKQQLILTREGDFFLKTNPKKSLSFRNAKKRLALFQTINIKFKATSELTSEAGIENNTATRKHIGTINAKIKTIFRMPNFIESKGNGYRINPAYKLTKK